MIFDHPRENTAKEVAKERLEWLESFLKLPITKTKDEIDDANLEISRIMAYLEMNSN